MKKNFVIILIIFAIILAIAGYYVYNIRQQNNLAKMQNESYEKYNQKEILGTTLISIINKTIDENEKNGVNIPKESIYYENNDENSVQIKVKFLEAEKPIKMEDIAKNKSETFIKFYATATFKCTKIEYHKKTNFVKSLYFEQIQM